MMPQRDGGVSHLVEVVVSVTALALVGAAVMGSGMIDQLGCSVEGSIAAVTEQTAADCEDGAQTTASAVPGAEPVYSAPPATENKAARAGRSSSSQPSSDEGGQVQPSVVLLDGQYPLELASEETTPEAVVDSAESYIEIIGVDLKRLNRMMQNRDFALDPTAQYEAERIIGTWNAVLPQLQAVANDRLDPFDDPGRSILETLDNQAYLIAAASKKVEAITGHRIPQVTVTFQETHTIDDGYDDGSYS